MRIWYVSSGPFPEGAAYSTRLVGFARLLQSLGHDVLVVCDETSLPTRSGSWDGIPYEAIGATGHSIARRLLNSFRVRSYLRGHAAEAPDLVILRSDADRFRTLADELDRQGIRFVVEVCEKYHRSSWRWWAVNPFYWQYRRAYRHQFGRAHGVIAISRYLSSEFESVPRRVVVPTILDVVSEPWRERVDGPGQIRLVYAGSPGRGKELIREIIDGLAIQDARALTFEFHLYGIGPAQLSRYMPDKRTWPNIVAHGRRPLAEVLEAYRDADFGIFVRPNRESSDAGFPTKLAEAMMCGTPCVCNDSGDVGVYVDGSNGVLLPGSTAADVAASLGDIAMKSPADLTAMRRAARSTAEAAFDYRSHAARVAQFLEELPARSNERK